MIDYQYGNVSIWEPIRAHPSKGGVAKLKAYLAAMQRASAGEAHGAGRSIEALQGLQRRDTVA